MVKNIINSLIEAKQGLEQLLTDNNTITAINTAAQMIIRTFENGGKVFSCGNGGSMCDAMHFAEELTGQYRKKRRGFPAIAISDPGHLTCVANDYGFNEVFSRYLAAHGNKGDSLLAISTSGSSKNILAAVSYAKLHNIGVIGLSGKKGSTLTEQADISICTPVGNFADRIQEIHIKILHIIIELIERHFCPENYSN
jgi:D-sedoheptulose 7-phosphate isomerase